MLFGGFTVLHQWFSEVNSTKVSVKLFVKRREGIIQHNKLHEGNCKFDFLIDFVLENICLVLIKIYFDLLSGNSLRTSSIFKRLRNTKLLKNC